ncbi:MAG: flagellar biosynthesis protein FlgJ [Novosphingobium sp.]|nr:flagellar biosynthesis protein FlgJ [Novosphingobium sp.]
MSTIPSTLPGMKIAPGATDREKLAATARQFEAMFVRQMLAEARKSHFGGEQLFSSQALDTFNQMQDEHFADVTAQSGVLGLARIIEDQMARFVAESSSAPGQAPSASDAPSDTASSAHAEAKAK